MTASNFVRTFRLDKLYHQFLKAHSIPHDKLDDFARTLHKERFIIIFITPLGEKRYIETEKLLSKSHKKDVFKIIQRIKDSCPKTALK